MPIEWTLPACPVAHCYRMLPYAERMAVIGKLARHWLAMLNH